MFALLEASIEYVHVDGVGVELDDKQIIEQVNRLKCYNTLLNKQKNNLRIHRVTGNLLQIVYSGR